MMKMRRSLNFNQMKIKNIKLSYQPVITKVLTVPWSQMVQLDNKQVWMKKNLKQKRRSKRLLS
jgi:hypothetical protein